MNIEPKAKYEAPQISVIAFSTEDIITTSGFEGEAHFFTNAPTNNE